MYIHKYIYMHICSFSFYMYIYESASASSFSAFVAAVLSRAILLTTPSHTKKLMNGKVSVSHICLQTHSYIYIDLPIYLFF